MIRIPLFDDEPVTDTFPYRAWPFVVGECVTPAGVVPVVSAAIRFADKLGGWKVRWGIGRHSYRVRPGLYALGAPTATAPVLVTANYKLTFDLLRSSVAGLDAWLLVLDTKGINVWCAAGKNTFGTAELIRRVRETALDQVVTHRFLLLPQLCAVGVAAHEISKRCGFRVIYGPVRASDIKAFVASDMSATPAMRRVTFSVAERLVLIPVELTGLTKSHLKYAPVLLLLGGIGPDTFALQRVFERGGPALLAWGAGLLAGAVMTPILLPWIPGRAFAGKGALCGAAIGVVGVAVFGTTTSLGDRVALLCTTTAVSSWCAMHFTGATPFTSPSGVEKEMRRAMPFQFLFLLLAAGLWITGAFWRLS